VEPGPARDGAAVTILGIETSGPACEVAVLRVPAGGTPAGIPPAGARDARALMRLAVTERLRPGESKARHAEALFGLLDRVLARARCRRGELDAVAVSIGPGSFTGLRIGLAAAKVLTRFGGLRLCGVPSLEAMATASAASGVRRLVPVVDAMRGEVYAAAYRAGPAGFGRSAAPRVCGPEALDSLLGRDGVLVTVPPRAAAVAALGALRLARRPRGDDPDRLVPLYVRRPAAVEQRGRR
jgi:tRNA threonylcarbamoyladenosine biosynthesis protein TsaB